MTYYLTIFAVAFLGSWLLNFHVRAIATTRGFLDYPSERKLHTSPTPYGGGVGLYLALVVALVGLDYLYPPALLFRDQMLGLIIGGMIVVLFGLWDDVAGSGALLKLTAEALVAIFMYYMGFRIDRISVPAIGTLELGHFGIIPTIFWFWLMMNAINLIDGLDGLAAGVAAISAGTILVITFEQAQPFNNFLAIIVIGICLGFLPHNFHPAKLFMGDAGSLILGFLIAALSLSTSTKAPTMLPLLIPFLAVGMPVFDTAHAFLRRILQGRHPFRADTKHLHYRLMALGLSQRRTVLFLYYISAYLGVMAYVLSRTSAQITIVVVGLLMLGLFLLTENLAALNEKRRDSGQQ